MSNGDGFGVHLDELHTAEHGVRQAVTELDAIGGAAARSAGAGQDGRGLDQLDTSEDTVGHAQLASALAEFVDRWNWEVKTLVEDGNQAAQALADTRSTYQRAEDSALSAVKQVAQIAGGDPMGEGSP